MDIIEIIAERWSQPARPVHGQLHASRQRKSVLARLAEAGLVALLTLFVTPAMADEAPAQPSAGYVFDSGDTLTIHVAGQADLSTEVVVDERGNITLPIVGRTPVRGLDPEAAEKAITAKLVDMHILLEPRVTVWAKALRPIYVMGDVRTPGVYPFQSYLTVKNAVVIAGGYGTSLPTGYDTVLAAGQTVSELEQERMTLLVRKARLEAQLARKAAFEAPKGSTPVAEDLIARVVAEEQKVLESRVSNFNAEVDGLTKQLEYNKTKIEASEQQEELGKKQQKLFAERLERYDALQKQGIVRDKDGFELHRDDNMQRTLAMGLEAEQARYKAEAAGVESKLKELAAEFERDTLTEITAVGDRLRALSIALPTAEAIYRQRQAQVGGNGIDEPIRSVSIVRTKNGSTETLPASEMTQLQPGDLVEVKILARPAATWGSGDTSKSTTVQSEKRELVN